MATVKDIKKGFCDDIYTELGDIKGRIEALQGKLERTYPTEHELFMLYDRHLHELAEQIDWKLQILSHACSYDWKGSAGTEFDENTVSVGTAESFDGDFSGGYVGG